MGLFANRTQAGQELAAALIKYKNNPDVLILALPRGGVPVAFEVAKKLHLPLDVCLVRKLGVPHQEELAMGAIALNGTQVFNQAIIEKLGISQDQIAQVITREQQELDRRNMRYRQNRPFPKIAGKSIILIDDGIATGASVYAAIVALKQLKPAHIIVAVPVGAADICQTLPAEVVCLHTPEPFYGVGAWYTDFSQTSDQEVAKLLAESKKFMI